MSRIFTAVGAAIFLAACNNAADTIAADTNTADVNAPLPFVATAVASFDEPWAMTFLPGTKRMLVTERKGRLLLVDRDTGKSIPVAGNPEVDYGGQGGFGDVALSPDYKNDGFVYLSWAEPGPDGTRGAAVGRGKLIVGDGEARLDAFQILWRQEPKVSGRGHYSHRILFSPDGQYMYLSSGERQKFTPAQDMNQNLGKIVRLSITGMIPSDNPFYDQGRLKAQIWSYGHRNILGLAFDANGSLWAVEMGPRGGDELNLIARGRNYGWPIVSNGDHYDGTPIPDHPERPEYEAPKVSWNPVISPSSLAFYSGDLFPAWKGSALIGGLSSESLIRVTFNGTQAQEAERFAMGKRIRAVVQGPDDALWLLEDGEGGRLLRLIPAGK